MGAGAPGRRPRAGRPGGGRPAGGRAGGAARGRSSMGRRAERVGGRRAGPGSGILRAPPRAGRGAGLASSLGARERRGLQTRAPFLQTRPLVPAGRWRRGSGRWAPQAQRGRGPRGSVLGPAGRFVRYLRNQGCAGRTGLLF